MTTPAGDDAVERAFEALLAGRPAGSAADGLVAFTEAVRASGSAPGRPSAALAELLVTGLPTDQSSPSTGTARSAGRDARRAPARRRRRRLRMLAPALFAKIASAGLAAKAATVAGVAVVGFSTAGFVGALPTPAQHTFATLVDHATPFTAPDPTSTTDAPDGTTTPTGDQTPTAGDTTAPATETPAAPTPFGQQVSQMAHDGHDGHPGVDGRVVSSMAHARHSTAADETAGETADETGATDTSADGDSQDTRSSTGGHSSGHGRSGNTGHGHG